MRLSLELIKHYEGSMKLSVYQYYNFPSMFQVVFKHLTALKVKFPPSYLYVK